jgi:hypothetical protein
MRSRRWFGGADLAGFIHRSSIHAEGISRAALTGRPVVGICNSAGRRREPRPDRAPRRALRHHRLDLGRARQPRAARRAREAQRGVTLAAPSPWAGGRVRGRARRRRAYRRSRARRGRRLRARALQRGSAPRSLATAAATARSTSTTCCRPTRAATSTSCAPFPARTPRASPTACSRAGSAAGSRRSEQPQPLPVRRRAAGGSPAGRERHPGSRRHRLRPPGGRQRPQAAARCRDVRPSYPEA